MRPWLAAFALITSVSAQVNTKYLAVYMNGQKVGYASYRTAPAKLHGNKVVRSDSQTVMTIGLQGSTMKYEEDSTTWATKDGRPLLSQSTSSSSGRTEKTTATFGKTTVEFQIDNGGNKSKKTVPIPTGAPVYDDPLSVVLNGGLKTGVGSTFYEVDSSTMSFSKSTVTSRGPSTTTIKGKNVKATLIEIKEQGIVTKVYLTKGGDVLRVLGPAGLEMLPVSRAVALGKNTKYNPAIDLSEVTSIKSDNALDNAADITRLKLTIRAENLPDFHSDAYQTVTKNGSDCLFDIHPPVISKDPPATIDKVASMQPEWVKPSLDMPSDSPRFKKAAAAITGSTKDAQNATFAIQRYVYQVMKPNAGIGVLRDATEVLDTKEGVCRDYAVLTVTLLRAARIPARLASGLVSWDGTFYYHMWAEAWDGTNWIGVDSTTDTSQMSAVHVKFGEGNVDTAYSFSFLGKAKISVVDVSRD